MGFYLLDRPNPSGPNYYTSRREPLLAIVMHGTAGSEDLDTINDLSAENVAGYAATTDRDVSWHTGSDADSWVNLLPSTYTAWHATDYNSCTHGHEISKRHMDWRSMPPLWVDKTLRMAALGPDGNGGLRKVALDNGIPLRWATRAELDERRANYRAGRPWRAVGFITHHEVQPGDRTDPGYVWAGGRLIDTFPRARFMALLNQQEEDDMYTEGDRARDNAIAWRLKAFVDVVGETADDPNAPKPREAVQASIDLNATKWRIHNLLNLKEVGTSDRIKGDPLPFVKAFNTLVADVAELKANATAPAIDYDQLADALARAGVFPTVDAIADELDARARDNDHTTGPVS